MAVERRVEWAHKLIKDFEEEHCYGFPELRPLLDTIGTLEADNERLREVVRVTDEQLALVAADNGRLRDALTGVANYRDPHPDHLRKMAKDALDA